MQNLLYIAKIIYLLTGILFLTACASGIPEIIEKPPAEDLSLVRVQAQPEKHQGKVIRWGGDIIHTENKKDQTTLTVLAKPLDSYGEPMEGDKSYGRFIAIIKGFLDPAIYAKGRSITVYGRYEKILDKKIDNFDYRYPLVKVEHFYLWQVPEKVNYNDYPYWYDPWYPYWGPYYHPHRHY
ncbi:MAG: Slp family lipoprotein [Gammaproteobacteria bacterium]|nr:Slp family lipoprotein [Gammaproteobacteria bacterium]